MIIKFHDYIKKHTVMFQPASNGMADKYGAAMYRQGKQEIAATMHQALGSIESSAMPDGEWKRCMDWLSATANGVDAGELLPVYSLEGAG